MAEEQKEEKFEKLTRRELLAGTGGFVAGIAVGSGGVSLLLPPKEVEVPVEVIKEVPIEVIKEVPVEVIKEVPVEVLKEVEEVKEVEINRYACPYCDGTFSTLGALRVHVDSEHQPTPTSIRESEGRPTYINKVDKPTYDDFVVETIEQFDQKNEVFSRSVWDEEYKKRRAEAPLRVISDDMAELEGNAFQTSGWYVHRKAGPSGNAGPGGLKYKDLYDWNIAVSKVKLPVSDPAKMSERIKYVAKSLGADLVGICELNQRWVYSHYYDRNTQEHVELNAPYKYAIVIAIEMKWEDIKKSPGWEASAATGVGYSKMAFIAPSLAAYINGLGYPAIPAGNDLGQSIPLAIDAGLGELGRLGLLITPEFGPRVRLCKVLTDLPLKPDKPIEFRIQRFCESCVLCAKSCPMGAIKFGERTTEPTSISNRTGLLRWPVDVVKCHIFWQMNRTSCANCIAACPWSDMGIRGEIKYNL
ncbi:MAG: reductive dehalogenase [Methanocellales archaeon]|nr:reductive dehalogenase [Methanocellales archaeon]MDD3291807.1 reductive dehalogenase [Methanocellales archaeon]MDD5234579.1 reductive dehalogenase [Methanocellales archaeon]MDD5485068.1 reductive dehalogenase [Methanocellales archaeon]